MSNAASPSPSSAQSNSSGSNSSGSNSSGSNYWVDVMVEFEPPAADPPDDADRSERYQYLHVLAQQHRAELQAWIAQEGLESEINHISEATAFDLLFARVTPAAAAALQHAPGVVAVMPATDAADADAVIYHNGQRLRYA